MTKSETEIKKGLYKCSADCGLDCPYFSERQKLCVNILISDALELIETQQVEIENARAEAIRDFAEKFDDVLAEMRDEYAHNNRPEYGLVCEVVHHKLLKTMREMVGAENESKYE